jgi:hypothetical protein
MANSVKKQKVNVKGKVVSIGIDADNQFHAWKSGHSTLKLPPDVQIFT